MTRRSITWLFVAAMAAVASAVATASGPSNLYDGHDAHEGIGQSDGRPMHRGVLYGASKFPLALRLRPADAQWEGQQNQSGRFRFVQIHHLRTGNTPLHGVGYITFSSATGTTPPLAKTVKRLRATPHVKFGPITTATVSGFAAKAFDATITGSDHVPGVHVSGVSIDPFTVNHHCLFCGDARKWPNRETRDVKFAGTGQLFHIIVTRVRGKTVVIYIESIYADQRRHPPATIFPTFLPYANKMLATLHFPAS
jgi:hypothetical protein